MSHTESLMDLVHEFKMKSVMFSPPTTVIMHPETERELIREMSMAPRIAFENMIDIITIQIMDAKMRLYRSFDVEQGKFVIG